MARNAARPKAKRRRSPGRPRAKDGARPAHADRIVQSAATLFAKKGFAQTTTAEIARAAGSSEGTLFHHFPTKRALLAEVGRREGARVFDLAFASIDPAAPPTDLDDMLRRLFDYAKKEPATYRLFMMDGDLEDLEAGFSAKRDRIITGLSALLAGWSARGFLRKMNPDVVAELIFALVDGSVRRLVLDDRWNDQQAWLEETSRAVRALLGPSPEPAPPGAPTKGHR